MGMFCNPCCCVCGASPMKRNDEWLQDFCPEHKPKEYVQYIGGEMSDENKILPDDSRDKHIKQLEKQKAFLISCIKCGEQLEDDWEKTLEG